MEVWNLSINLSLQIYKLTLTFPEIEKFSLIQQLRRSATSVPTNLVEGISRDSFKEQARFTTIAYGSLMECLNLLVIAHKLDYFKEDVYGELRDIINKISNQLNSLKKSQLKRT
ncbi:MAG: four helix bundle protein [Flavobacteriaceae bacterium]